MLRAAAQNDTQKMFSAGADRTTSFICAFQKPLQITVENDLTTLWLHFSSGTTNDSVMSRGRSLTVCLKWELSSLPLTCVFVHPYVFPTLTCLLI